MLLGWVKSFLTNCSSGRANLSKNVWLNPIFSADDALAITVTIKTQPRHRLSLYGDFSGFVFLVRLHTIVCFSSLLTNETEWTPNIRVLSEKPSGGSRHVIGKTSEHLRDTTAKGSSDNNCAETKFEPSSLKGKYFTQPENVSKVKDANCTNASRCCGLQWKTMEYIALRLKIQTLQHPKWTPLA